MEPMEPVTEVSRLWVTYSSNYHIVIFFVTKIIRETLDKANSITFYGFNLLHNSIIMNFDLETRD